MTSHLAAVTLIIPDYDDAIAFFTKVLSFTLTADVDQGHKRWVTVAGPSGGAAFVLARAEGPEQTAMIGRQGAGRVWLFLHSADLETDRRRMEAAGVKFEEPTRHEPYGKVAVWQDPWGNRWDLLRPPDPFCPPGRALIHGEITALRAFFMKISTRTNLSQQ